MGEVHNGRSEKSNPVADPKNEFVARLFALYDVALRAHLARLVRRPAEAEELAQEVYLRMLRVPDPELIRNPEAYLITVASNLAKERGVKEYPIRAACDIEDPEIQEHIGETPNFSGEIDKEIRIERLREVLPQLSRKCHAVVVLRFWKGLSYQEIATLLEISPDMVKKYLKQALEHCRRRMARLR